ncbi:hypothetical protein C8J56DRAFT_920809 [Mycena floridula]|nr:hypothetical protein C8J56DRAFT_920809 [Mycena floridula]
MFIWRVFQIINAVFVASFLSIFFVPKFYMFDATKCAQIHNQILAASHLDRNAVEITNFFAAYDAQDYEAANPYLSESILEFLSKIDVAIPIPPDSEPRAFTPDLRMPHPASFWSLSDYDPDESYPYAIQLYPRLNDAEGGILFDMSTNLVTMGLFPGLWPHPDQWWPLEEALQRYLHLFETGKYHGVDEEPHVDHDVLATLTEYHALLDAISSRIDGAVIHDRPLVSAETLQRWKITGFAFDFLSRAKTPSFTYIAPGITVYSDEIMDALMTKDTGSTRQKLAEERQFEPFLIFPSDETVEQVNPMFEIDAPFLLEERAGVYLWGTDELQFVLPYPLGENGYLREGNSPLDLEWKWRVYGNNALYQHGHCPYFGSHYTKLRTLLHLWTHNVEKEQFVVGPDGVEGGMELYKEADSAEPAINFDVGHCWEIVPVNL